ncbi:helix-turn-helix transcriptional regulator [Haloimpatiens lingqiaonensis]|uniref:helix-turn-helix transcriptional regulator n=1 Tax=Haloimpatiens lingqiaonensis TaxID=1380675 RepID=UPI001485BC65|nr:helix-turn-helix domain-containing protein [Haloimpatiens lingqiaonensis]
MFIFKKKEETNNIERIDMKNIFIDENSKVKEIESLNNSYNIATIKQLTKSVILGNVSNALLIYRNVFNIKKHEYINNLNPIKIMKYNLVSLCINLINASIVSAKILEKDTIEMKNKYIADIDKQTNIEDLLITGENMIKGITCFINNYSLKNKSNCIEKAVNYINNNFNEPITLGEVSNYVHLNSSYLCTLFKAEMNESFKSYLNRLRIEHSKSMLLTTNNSILDVALSVGFDNQSYFSTVFKKYTNMSPKEYIDIHKKSL